MKRFDVLAVGPHPDDIELGCGGTILSLSSQGHSVALVDLTASELSSRGTTAIRQVEAENARVILGAGERFQLNLTEGELTNHPENINKLVTLIRETKPTLVFAPYAEDRHPDHRAASELIKTACFWSGVPKYGDNQLPHRPHRIVYYYLHSVDKVSLVVDISAHFNQKQQAIRVYESQFSVVKTGEMETYISKPEFMHRIVSRAEYYGSLIGAQYGEPLHVNEVSRVDNLMDWLKDQGLTG